MQGDSKQGMTEKTSDPQNWFLEKINKNDRHQINNKVLLQNTGNYIQHPLINHDGE